MGTRTSGIRGKKIEAGVQRKGRKEKREKTTKMDREGEGEGEREGGRERERPTCTPTLLKARATTDARTPYATKDAHRAPGRALILRTCDRRHPQ